ncbi:MAG TPA: GNAT family N-acetyltransferase [Pirellulaceae bacterium]|nr:GNAT family N-acetyltransferase [Pirellulaceae bacterium]HMO92240.1 GNAT family N-acetyltransferase [Pirellulaceae bacterium]HMP70749.1 GNAT family N-acetyltransferase [Pirellulaceae bacterium]
MSIDTREVLVRLADLKDLNDKQIVEDLHLIMQAEGRTRYGLKQLSETDIVVHRQGICKYLQRTEFESVIFLAINDQNTVIGIAICQSVLSTWALQRVLNVHDLFVKVAARRQGIARRLVTEIANWCKANSYACIKLETTLDNLAARKLYQSLGFSGVFLDVLNPDFPNWESVRSAVIQMRLNFDL